MVDEATKYSEADLAEFKEIILIKFKSTIRFRFNKSAYMNDLNNGTDDTPTFKKPLRRKETMSKEDSQFVKFIRDLKNALSV
jgi:hypothetical protein